MRRVLHTTRGTTPTLCDIIHPNRALPATTSIADRSFG